MFARTDRLLLRPGWIEDAPALFTAIRDEAIVRNLATAPSPYRLDDAAAFLATERKADDPVMLIFRRTGGEPELIGTIGFAGRPGGEVELGYWIARAHWNRGYATEAGAAVLRMARDTYRLPRLVAGHFLDNPASGRVLEKLGFRPTGAIMPRYSAGRGAFAPVKNYARELAEADAEEAMAA
ncbi:MAG: GNAT family N-acetyltransferase [Allosphingosinicella sp.]